MIDRSQTLPVKRQAKELGISRGSVYYLPRPVSSEDLAIMRRIDALHLEFPFARSRMMRDFLREGGITIGRCHVASLMKKMVIEVVYRRPSTSKPAPGHKIYPYLLRKLQIVKPNQVWATDVSYIPMARGFVCLVAIVDWFGRKVLSYRISITVDADFCVEALESPGALWQARDLQYGSAQSIHQPGLHRRAAARGHRHKHGRARRLARQCRGRAAVALGEVRGGLPARLRLRQRSAQFDRPNIWASTMPADLIRASAGVRPIKPTLTICHRSWQRELAATCGASLRPGYARPP
jgi:hypothetical protein